MDISRCRDLLYIHILLGCQGAPVLFEKYSPEPSPPAKGGSLISISGGRWTRKVDWICLGERGPALCDIAVFIMFFSEVLRGFWGSAMLEPHDLYTPTPAQVDVSCSYTVKSFEESRTGNSDEAS